MANTTMFRDFTTAKNIIDAASYDVSYMYDDLIFVNHNAFILRYDDECENNFFLHFNNECDKKEIGNITSTLEKSALLKGVSITKGRSYTLTSIDENEELKLEFAS